MNNFDFVQLGLPPNGTVKICKQSASSGVFNNLGNQLISQILIAAAILNFQRKQAFLLSAFPDHPKALKLCPIVFLLFLTIMATLEVQTELQRMCRACMTTEGVDKFNSLHDEPLKSQFTECTSIEVTEDDPLPTELCFMCVARCIAAKHFRDQALSSNEQFKLFPAFKAQEASGAPPVDTQEVVLEEETIMLEVEVQEEPEEDLYEILSEEIIYEPEENKSIAAAPETDYEESQDAERAETAVLHCETCKKNFLGEDLWRSHECLANDQNFVCELCGKSFKHMSHLANHQKSHSLDQFDCKLCPKQFKIRSHYMRHMVRHGMARNFVCEVCDKSFKEKKDVMRHIELVHAKSRLLKCEHCPKSFSFGYMLKRHMQVHTGLRPYPCSVCKASLSSTNALKHHMYTHTGAKPYKCEECPESFRLRVGLNKHRKVHHCEVE